MEENRFNQTWRDKFQDLESPLNDRVTFEAVMKKREKKKRRVIFWLPSVAVVAGLFLSAGLGYMLLSDADSAVKSPQLAVKDLVSKPNKKPVTTIADHKLDQPLNDINPNDVVGSNAFGSSATVERKQSGVIAKAIKPNIEQNPEAEGAQKSEKNPNVEDQILLNNLNVPMPNPTGVSMKTETEVEEMRDVASLDQDNTMIYCDPRGIYPVSIGYSKMKEEFIEIPEGEYEKSWDPGGYRSKWYGELGATTGSKVIVDFDNKNALSVLGTMYHANYQGLILRDLGNGVMLGTGLSYGEWIGNGEWQLTQTERKTYIDSYDLVVMIPPVQTVRVYDTSEVIESKVTTGEIHYKIDKVSLPLAMRYNLMLGRISWRLAAQVNPGITTKTSGDFFTKTEYHPITEQKMLSMDAKLAFGPSFALTTDWTLVLEPNAMLHSFYDKSGKRSYSKVLTGFGMTVVRKF